MSADRPMFSIVMPVFNRERLVGRAIRSCLAQDFHDFEIMVVDDASSDASVDAVRAFDDPRIRLIVHEQNRGVGPARNTAMAASRGEWIVFLDSDDELLPGGLAAIARSAASAGADVDGMRFMVRMDTGEISPDPPLDGSVWDYESYLRWTDRAIGRRQETLPVVRRRTFERVRYSDGRALEALYHLDFARLYRIQACPDIVRLYHHDAPNQLTKADAGEWMRSAADQASQTEELLERHGEAMARWAPRLHEQLVAGLATMYFLAGNRRAGLRAARASLRARPLSARQWVVLLAGILGPRPLARLKAMRT